MNKKKVINRIKSGKFSYSLNELLIVSNVTKVFESEGEIGIQFEAGNVGIRVENIKEVKISEKLHEWKYELVGKKGEHLGYIFPKGK